MIKLTKNQILSWTGGENNFEDYNPEIANVVTDSRKIQENDFWVDAIIYKPNDCEELFVRTTKEFENKFSKSDN